MKPYQIFPTIVLQSIIIGIAQHAHLSTSSAFTVTPPSISIASLRSRTHPLGATRTARTKLHQSSSDVFVLSYDGVVANTNHWRANLAIDVALETWPYLQEFIENDTEWLINKVSALLPVTLSGEDGMMGCDAVLLARVLLEEQLLDEGRSNGCRGKYGSKFHPSSDDKTGESSQENKGNGSRPLTVGEISANWNDGACLKDTVRIKYNVDRKDPIPIIKEKIRDCLETSNDMPDVYPSILDALVDCSSPVYILVGDESHVPTAISSLTQHSIPVQSMTWDQHDAIFLEKNSGITIIPPGEGGRGHEGVLQHILMSVEKGSSVHLIHSDVATLQQAKSLFGDNRPRPGMFEKSGIVDAFLKLSLSTLNSGPQQQNDATMDPWLNLIDEFELVETLSARIVTK